MEALGEAFDRFNENGTIEFRYTTECYYGAIGQ
jgi:hypothetical protein